MIKVETLEKNYNLSNIANIKKFIEEERNDQNFKKQVYTMVQVNSPCNVIISSSSRKKCARALVK